MDAGRGLRFAGFSRSLCKLTISGRPSEANPRSHPAPGPATFPRGRRHPRLYRPATSARSASALEIGSEQLRPRHTYATGCAFASFPAASPRTPRATPRRRATPRSGAGGTRAPLRRAPACARSSRGPTSTTSSPAHEAIEHADVCPKPGGLSIAAAASASSCCVAGSAYFSSASTPRRSSACGSHRGAATGRPDRRGLSRA